MELTNNVLSNDLVAFFYQWRNLYELEIVQAEPAPIPFNAERFSSFIAAYHEAKKSMDAARQLGFAANVWQAAGLGSDENRNSKVLKWLLDWRGNHGQENAIFQKFLQLLPEPFKNLQANNYVTTAECCPLGEQESRVDIEIDAENFLLFIEIKINASEGVNQLQRYQQIAQAKAKNRPWLVVYLTKTGTLPINYQQQQGFVSLSWKQIAKILNNYEKTAHADNRAAWLITQFANHINTF